MPDLPRPKHVLWITTDHQRHDGIGANGNPSIFTPNLDRLVRGGASFDDCWIQNPVSMPSRASFMTGLYPPQTGVSANGQELPRHHRTCAHLFAAADFRTAQIGKLHFQCHEDHDLWLASRHPYGFQYFNPSEEPGQYEDAYGIWLSTEHPEYRQAMKVARSTDPARVALNGTVVDAPGDVSHAGFCADRTMTYLRAHGAQGPSFIHMGIYAPHPPLNPPREIYERYRDVKIPEPHRRDGEHLDKPAPLGPALERRTGGTTAEQFVAWRRYFYAMCTLLDEQIGRVLKFLEARGELDDTLIVFQSDHGDMAGDHGLLSKGHVTLYPECMRIPLVFHWPKGIPGGRRVGGLVEAVDILPTMLDLCGAPVPRQLPGRSLAEGLRGGNARGSREDVLALMRNGAGGLACMLRGAEHHYLNYGPGAEVLFDLREDPSMYVNQAGNPKYASALSHVRARALARTLAASDPVTEKVHNY